MPGRRHGPHARVHAALSRLTLAALVLAGLLGCGNGETPIDLKAIRFSGTIEPDREIKAYGEILPCTITITNDGPVPVFIDRVEALSGHRRTLVELTRRYEGEGLAVGPDGDLVPSGKPERFQTRAGLIFPGQSLRFLTRYRVLEPSERLLLTLETTTDRDLAEGVWLGKERADSETFADYRSSAALVSFSFLTSIDRDPSKIHEGGALATVACPPPPFDPNLTSRNLEGWSFSTALGGFVLRNSGTDYRLLSADGSSALPPLPFELLDDVDDRGTAIASDGVVVVVRPRDLADFLAGVAIEGRRIRKTNRTAKYEVVEE